MPQLRVSQSGTCILIPDEDLINVPTHHDFRISENVKIDFAIIDFISIFVEKSQVNRLEQSH